MGDAREQQGNSMTISAGAIATASSFVVGAVASTAAIMSADDPQARNQNAKGIGIASLGGGYLLGTMLHAYQAPRAGNASVGFAAGALVGIGAGYLGAALLD